MLLSCSLIAAYSAPRAPWLPIKEACENVCVRVCIKLTHDIQLSNAVFDAAAVSGHTCVSARVVRSDICDHQGTIGHLLEPGGKKRTCGTGKDQNPSHTITEAKELQQLYLRFLLMSRVLSLTIQWM